MTAGRNALQAARKVRRLGTCRRARSDQLQARQAHTLDESFGQTGESGMSHSYDHLANITLKEMASDASVAPRYQAIVDPQDLALCMMDQQTQQLYVHPSVRRSQPQFSQTPCEFTPRLIDDTPHNIALPAAYIDWTMVRMEGAQKPLVAVLPQLLYTSLSIEIHSEQFSV